MTKQGKLCGRCSKPKGTGKGFCKCGRPTKYKGQETCDMVDEYLKINSDSYDDQGRLKVLLPTIGGLALFLGVAESTLQEWEKEHAQFSVSLRKLVKEQESRLLNKGLSNEYNPTIAKLVLSANHGYKERTDQTTNDKDLPTPIYGGKSKGV